MGKKTVGEMNLSALMLGTAQFGLKYGLANKAGQPSYETARDIIACAYGGGVNCLDTAGGYGTSEEVIGRALAELGLRDKMTVVTKASAVKPGATVQNTEAHLEEQVHRSLKRLGLERLAICLLHAEGEYCFIESLLKLRDKGLIGHVGLSVITVEATLTIMQSDLAEAFQIPLNVLDRRFTSSDVPGKAKDKGIAVFARSGYLQGLVVMAERDILPELAEVIPTRRKLEKIASEAGMSMAELAIRYVLSIRGIRSAVVGVETIEQMRENIALYAKGPLSGEVMSAIDTAVPHFPAWVLHPRLWSTAHNR